jgi:hypothetical protein
MQGKIIGVNATDESVDCFSYETGPFVGTTLCETKNVTNSTCTITINGGFAPSFHALSMFSLMVVAVFW